MSKVKCTYCKEYVDKDEAILFGLGFACSQVCLQKKRKNQQEANRTKAQARAATTPGKRKRSSGTSKRKDPFPEGRKEATHARDHYRCRFCGRRSNHLVVHHIIYRSQPGCTHEMDNLISLCELHHLEIHSNKNLYQPIAQQIIAGGDTWITIEQVLND